MTQDENNHSLHQWNSHAEPFDEEVEQGLSNSHEPCHSSGIGSSDRRFISEDDRPLSETEKPRRIATSGQNIDLEQEISDTRRKLLFLERQHASESSNSGPNRILSMNSMSEPRPNGRVMFNHSVGNDLQRQQTIPDLIERTWPDFMNKHTDEDCEYAIEVLKGEPQYSSSMKPTEKADKQQNKLGSLRPELETRQSYMSSEKGEEMVPVPDRIRINSPFILNILSGVDKSIDKTGSMLMLRPFKLLIRYEEQIRDSIRVLAAHLQTPEATSSHHNNHLESLSSLLYCQTPELRMVAQDLESCQSTFNHLKCLMDFFDRYINPTVSKLKNSTECKIQFRDLWYIFRTGEDIFMPIKVQRRLISADAMLTTPEIFQNRYNMLWRVTGTAGGRPNLSTAQARKANLEPSPFKVNCYYIDYDGKYFCPTTHTFSITPFKGEVEVTSLDFFPLRFMKGGQSSVLNHSNKRKTTFDGIKSGFTHFYYSGPTLVVHPCGCSLQKENLHQEYVESEVIVDFRTTLLENPGWRPKPSWKPPPIEQRERQELQERHAVHYWADRTRTKIAQSERDYVYDDYFVDVEHAATFRNQEPIFNTVPNGGLSNEDTIPEKDVKLLPSRVFGYVLRTRTFGK